MLNPNEKCKCPTSYFSPHRVGKCALRLLVGQQGAACESISTSKREASSEVVLTSEAVLPMAEAIITDNEVILSEPSSKDAIVSYRQLAVDSPIAYVCASCPEDYQDAVTAICLERGIQKAYGRSGDMVNGLSGKDWIPKWQSKVVLAAVTKANTLNSSRVIIVCIEGGKHCDQEYAQIPFLKRAIDKEWQDNGHSSPLRVDVAWVSFQAFSEDFGSISNMSTSSPSAKTTCVSMEKTTTVSSLSDKGRVGKDISAADLNPIQEIAQLNIHSTSATTKPRTQTKSAPNPKESVKVLSAPSREENKLKSREENKLKASSLAPSLEIKCDECGRGFKSDDALSSHRQSTNHFKLIDVFICVECSKHFGSMESFNQHIRATGHRDVQTHLVQQQRLDVVVNTAPTTSASKEVETHVCGECEAVFNSEHAWRQHQSALSHKDPTCKVCSRTFGSKTALSQHLEATKHYRSEKKRT
jgi:hypothetical protein